VADIDKCKATMAIPNAKSFSLAAGAYLPAERGRSKTAKLLK